MRAKFILTSTIKQIQIMRQVYYQKTGKGQVMCEKTQYAQVERE